MPEEFGRYELHDLLGRGGMGEVYRALDTVRDRTVALKLLSKHLAADESFKTRFRRESRMVARLNEPHIIPIHDFGEIENQLFLDMRLVEGADLGTVLADGGALQAEVAVAVIAQVASALDAAHRSGLVHRDVKPSNVLLTGLGEDRGGEPFAYLVDFGIAHSATQEGTALTATTGTVGTVAYMSPERIGGDSGDHTTDVYALACVLYETLTGHKPFDGELFAMMYAHMHTVPPKVTARVPGIPPGLDEVVGKGMSKNPEDRYASAGEFARAARAALRAAARSAPTAVVPATTPAPPPVSPPRPATPPPPPGHVNSPPPPVSREAAARSGAPSPAAAPAGAPPVRFAPTPPPPPRMTGPATAGGTAPPGPPTGPPFRGIPAPSGPVGWTGSDPGARQWNTPPPAHPSGPIRPYDPGPPQRRSRRPAMIAAATVVLLVAVVSVVIAVSRGGSPAADKPGPSPTSSAPNNGAGVPTTLNTGGPSPAIAWAHFASFSKLVGAKDGDTAHALKNGSCKVEGPASGDVVGLLDQVECTLSTPGVKVFVARFDTAQSVRTYLGRIITTQLFNTTAWATGGKTRGLEFTAPTSASYLDITSSICALPTYLVQFYLSDKTKLDRKALIADYWGAATFPDAVPPACNDSFTGAAAQPPTTGAAPAKSAADIGESALAALLVLSDATLKAVPVATPGGFEIIVVGQQGKVFFWSWDDSLKVLSNVGSSTYPYDPKSVGPPKAVAKGTVLSGTVDATFIVTGVFSGDGSGNTVAYTTGHIGWGAIKALPNGNLAPAAGGVTFGGIGLENEFAFVGGQLETADCSSTKPISECGGNNRVIKFWAWDHGLAQFVLSSTAGLPK